MPELPEVETVCRGLAPVMQGYVFERVVLNRADLRFAFSHDFIDRVQGQRLEQLTRRAKFLQAALSSGEMLLMHLGMSGRFTIEPPADSPDSLAGQFVHNSQTQTKHDHVIFTMSSGARIIFNDPRRFGFMELIRPGQTSRLDHLGPEPLSNAFNAPYLATALSGRKVQIKTALLDQRIIAGLGNIYVCEALFRAKLSPFMPAGNVAAAHIDLLCRHIKDVIREAIRAGGSSLKDFAHTDGALGYFQHSFDVYGRENQPCHICQSLIMRQTQSARSTFFCRHCQP